MFGNSLSAVSNLSLKSSKLVNLVAENSEKVKFHIINNSMFIDEELVELLTGRWNLVNSFK